MESRVTASILMPDGTLILVRRKVIDGHISVKLNGQNRTYMVPDGYDRPAYLYNNSIPIAAKISTPLSAAQMRNVIDATYLQHVTRAMVSAMPRKSLREAFWGLFNTWSVSRARRGRTEMMMNLFGTPASSVSDHELADYVTTHGVHVAHYFVTSIAELRGISNHMADIAVKEGHVEGNFVILTSETLESIEKGEI